MLNISKIAQESGLLENKIPKADAKRIARLLGNPDAVEEIEETGESTGAGFIDEIGVGPRPYEV